MIKPALQTEIQSLVQQNSNLFTERDKIKEFLNKQEISPEDIDIYLKRSIIFLCCRDFIEIFISVLISAGLLYIIASLSMYFMVVAGVIYSLIIFNNADSIGKITPYTITCCILSIVFNISVFVPICIILVLLSYRCFIVQSRSNAIKNLAHIEHNIETNYHQIVHLATPSLIAFVHQERMADVNSIHAHGFSCLPETYIHDILNQHLRKENIERINLQNNTILYKSNKIQPDDEMTTTYLEID